MVPFSALTREIVSVKATFEVVITLLLLRHCWSEIRKGTQHVKILLPWCSKALFRETFWNRT